MISYKVYGPDLSFCFNAEQKTGRKINADALSLRSGVSNPFGADEKGTMKTAEFPAAFPRVPDSPGRFAMVHGEGIEGIR
jgi:hypothetical protein